MFIDLSSPNVPRRTKMTQPFPKCLCHRATGAPGQAPGACGRCTPVHTKRERQFDRRPTLLDRCRGAKERDPLGVAQRTPVTAGRVEARPDALPYQLCNLRTIELARLLRLPERLGGLPGSIVVEGQQRDLSLPPSLGRALPGSAHRHSLSSKARRTMRSASPLRPASRRAHSPRDRRRSHRRGHAHLARRPQRLRQPAASRLRATWPVGDAIDVAQHASAPRRRRPDRARGARTVPARRMATITRQSTSLSRWIISREFSTTSAQGPVDPLTRSDPTYPWDVLRWGAALSSLFSAPARAPLHPHQARTNPAPSPHQARTNPAPSPHQPRTNPAPSPHHNPARRGASRMVTGGRAWP